MCFNLVYLPIISAIIYNYYVRNETFFTRPSTDWQRRYEALRASFVERLPARVVAQRFNYSIQYVRLLRHLFTHGKIDFSEPVPEGKINRRRVDSVIRNKIRNWRKHRLSSGDIAQLLSDEGHELSIRTVERVLREEGFPKLPRRTRLKIGMTVKGTHVPQKSRCISLATLDGKTITSPNAGLFLFHPFIAQFNFDKIISNAGLPGTKIIPAKNYLLSFLAFKLMGTERYAHAGDHAFDMTAGPFAGLNALPKCTAMSTYSYSLDEVHIMRLQREFVTEAQKSRLYDGKFVNLDFHTIPHFGDESVLENHWAGSRHKTMKGALTLFAQDAETKLILYTGADIMRSETDDQVQYFVDFWRRVHRGVKSTLVFDSKFTDYGHLSQLNNRGVKFITLRRRGTRLIDQVKNITSWNRISIPYPKRKFPHPIVHESYISLRHYEGEIRQIIVRGNGHEKPAFVITNDFSAPLETVVGEYARRWRVENGIAEAVKFFNLNALSSPILIKVHFDVVMTMIADTLYSMFATKMRGFEDCNAQQIYRHFIRGKGTMVVNDNSIRVIFPRRAHNPILRAVPWHRMPMTSVAFPNSEISFKFE